MVILVVEDEVLIGVALCMILRVAGYRVCGPAGSVDDALELAGQEAPDLALVDVNLGGGAEGLDLARALRHRHGATCIFLTGNAGIAHQARDAAIGVIAKPYSFDAVVGAAAFVAAAASGNPTIAAPRGLQLFH
jgi:two-component system, response regulator PdtaR